MASFLYLSSADHIFLIWLSRGVSHNAEGYLLLSWLCVPLCIDSIA